MNTASHPNELPAELTVIAYPDPTVEAHGFGPDHPYIEYAILPITGPSTTLMWKRLARLVIAAEDQPVTVEVADLFACLGLGEGRAKNSPGARTVARMINFGLADATGRSGQIVAVRRALAPWSASRAGRLPKGARRYHDAAIRPAVEEG